MNKENKKFRRSFLIVATIAILIWGSFYYMDNRPTEKEHKNISVILYHAGTGGWESLMEGMKQAESSYPVNINYIILEPEAGDKEQLEAVRKEIAGGAAGIILAACNSEMSVIELNEFRSTVPIITIESSLSDGYFINLTADNYRMGEIIENPKQYAKVDAYVALHKKDLQELTEELDQFGKRTPVYGIGNTPSTVAALEEGKIVKMVFQNEFNMGYLSIETLYNHIRGVTRENLREIEAFVVSKENVYGTKYERLLFPIIK